MKYAIIGTGNVGTALARQFSRAGIAVSIANTRGPETTAALITELGDTVTAVTIKTAVTADVIFLAIPFMAVETFARTRGDWTGKLIIDCTNAYGATPEFMAGRLSSNIVAAYLPGAALVKAFNQLPVGVLARDPAQHGGKRVVFIAANDEPACATVKKLAEQLGFSPIPLGRIDEGGRLIEKGAPLVLHNLIEYPFK
ncbi:MAG: NADP oxidoreductase coenzyme [Rhodospirillales bacterium 20-58-10]|nr:MAG: NADP oxidoreductase coenzyme [Rhodospirillales bacterium 20-58-10]